MFEMVGIAHAEGAAAPAGGAAGGFASLAPFILIFVVFYFLLIRPQQKRAKEHQTFLDNLKKGAKVVTSGGIHGRITNLTDSVVTLEVDDNVRIKVNRNAIIGSQESATTPAAPTASGGG